MLISLNWIRDFVSLPTDLDPADLAERFTRITAEVETVRRLDTRARGLVAARAVSVEPLPGTRALSHVVLDLGSGQTCETVTAATNVRAGDTVVFAPPGASIHDGPPIGHAEVAGRSSTGMILPGEDLGIELAVQEAILLPPDTEPGSPLDPALFDDFLIEVDNKSITHRPDLWGHYGIAREIAAIAGVDLASYPVEPIEDWADASLPEIPISIEDAHACPRYSGVLFAGVGSQPAPLWMQLRLGAVGLRPINGLVDLTNYIMLELGQPMHAFDAASVDRIEVAFGRAGDTFTTLDGVERRLPERALMIQSGGRNVALAGIMGGLETEVTDATETLLLESANFNPATIRRCATALGMRTDASARFEKALDPVNTVVAIQRFVGLARDQFKEMRLVSRLSDGYPNPAGPISVRVDLHHVARTVGRSLDPDTIRQMLEPLDFVVAEQDDQHIQVDVPSFRATRDVTLEADVIEEIARTLRYDTIEPELPRVGVRRFERNVLHAVERCTLEHFCQCEAFNEIHGYLWYDAARLKRLGIEPGECVTLRNPVSEGLHLLRRSLIPNMLDALVTNRFHFPQLRLLEVGSVFEPGAPQDHEYRHVGLLLARRGKKHQDALYRELKGAIERWMWTGWVRSISFEAPADARTQVWEDPTTTGEARTDGEPIGRIGTLPVAFRRVLDEHLAAWSVAWAELRLDPLCALDPKPEPLGSIPSYPLIEVDFSFVVPRSRRYSEVRAQLAGFSHPLLKRMMFLDSFEGAPLEPDQRSLTVRTIIGDDTRTLVDQDAESYRRSFETHLEQFGYKIRS